MTEYIQSFISEYENKIAELSKQANLAYFNATTKGDKDEFEKVSKFSLEISKVLSNKNDFGKLKEFKEKTKNKDPLLERHVKLIYNDFASSQFDEELHEKIIALQTKVEEDYSLFRAKIGEKPYTDNEIDDKLRQSTDSHELQKAWEASKEIGSLVSENVVKLVKMRNEAANKMGFSNYYEMSLSLNEQNHEELDELFDELDDLTREKFIDVKNEFDNYLSNRLAIEKEELRTWHYHDKYFQLGPKIYDVEYDKFFKNVNIETSCRNYFDGINLNIDDIIAASDLYERENKYQHAYCTEIDRDGDIRIVCNIKPNHKWMNVMLHESGHAAYDKYVDSSLPWVMRKYSHIITTESIALMFGRMSYLPSWLENVISVNEEEKLKISKNSFKSLMHEQLSFSRWSQVMYRFERKMYENPDQDLNKLWWDLVEKYQMVKRPEGRDKPDWASKIHLALYPGYYHNYILGELLASQLYHHIVTKVLGQEYTNNESFTLKKEVGKFLKEEFFIHGSKIYWNELIKSATGEFLTPKYYAKQFVG
jgi:peptidyl-dipeptidase A